MHPIWPDPVHLGVPYLEQIQIQIQIQILSLKMLPTWTWPARRLHPAKRHGDCVPATRGSRHPRHLPPLSSRASPP